MAKVTFRRGTAALYKERWKQWTQGNNSYGYLANAIYFSTDTHEIYLDGENFTFEEDVDFSSVISNVDYDKSNNTLTISYANSDIEDKVHFLPKVALKNGASSALSLDISTGANGEVVYEIGMTSVSDTAIQGIEVGESVGDEGIQNGDTIASAFAKMNDSLVWVEADELSE